MLLFLMASVMAGCGKEGEPEYRMDERGSLRSRADPSRNRLWVLGLDDVRVYDTRDKKLIRRISLPSWSVAGFTCMPDIALDRAGSAFISSNAQSRLWRVDAGSFEVKEYEISLLGKERWDIGFGALAITADGTLFAVTSSANSLWKIDIAGASASLVELYHPPVKACAFTAQFVERLERSGKP